MAWRDRLLLTAHVSRSLARLGRDAVGGGALPASPSELELPETFEAVLREGACDDAALLPPVTAVRATAIESPSSNCRNTIFEVGWKECGGPKPPGSVFVKQPCGDLPTRLFANVIGFWEIECAFCRSLAPCIAIPTPRIHAVLQRRSRFVIVMENLRDRADTKLFVNRHLLEGADPRRARRCLSALARLHARFAGLSPGERERALPLDLHPFLSPTRSPIIQALNRLAVAPCGRRAPEVFDRVTQRLYRRALGHWEELARRWYREPQTLLHGDSHLGNFFETGEAMGMLDFQGAHWGRGMRDVQYFLTHSVPPERLAASERGLVEHYVEERGRAGAPLSFEEAWSDYRGFSFQSLMTAVVSLGLGSFTDSDAVMRAMLERSVAAVRRLDFEGWLEEELGSPRNAALAED